MVKYILVTNGHNSSLRNEHQGSSTISPAAGPRSLGFNQTAPITFLRHMGIMGQQNKFVIPRRVRSHLAIHRCRTGVEGVVATENLSVGST